MQGNIEQIFDLNKNNGYYDDFKLDLDVTMVCWVTNFSSFSIMDIVSDFETDGE